jgi:hypothetical protein
METTMTKQINAAIKNAEAKIAAAHKALETAEKAGNVAALAILKSIKAMPCKTFVQIDAREEAMNNLTWSGLDDSDRKHQRFRDAIETEHSRVEGRLIDAEDAKVSFNGKRKKAT